MLDLLAFSVRWISLSFDDSGIFGAGLMDLWIYVRVSW
jgi:hypothetical protein